MGPGVCWTRMGGDALRQPTSRRGSDAEEQLLVACVWDGWTENDGWMVRQARHSWTRYLAGVAGVGRGGRSGKCAAGVVVLLSGCGTTIRNHTIFCPSLVSCSSGKLATVERVLDPLRGWVNACPPCPCPCSFGAIRSRFDRVSGRCRSQGAECCLEVGRL